MGRGLVIPVTLPSSLTLVKEGYDGCRDDGILEKEIKSSQALENWKATQNINNNYDNNYYIVRADYVPGTVGSNSPDRYHYPHFKDEEIESWGS